jgi:hypothetical protein
VRAEIAMDRRHVVAVAQGGADADEIASCQCPVYNEPSRSAALVHRDHAVLDARVKTIIS